MPTSKTKGLEELFTAPDNTSQKQIDKLNAAAPANFRSEYDPMQVNAHKSAVSLFERYAKGATT